MTTRFADGPPVAGEGYVQAVEERGPNPTAIRSSTRDCDACGGEICVGRERFVFAHIRHITTLAGSDSWKSSRVRFCDWQCWQAWASLT